MIEKTLTIFLLTHNRPNDAILAIKSILQQSNNHFRLIVSDNSDSDEMTGLIQSLPAKVEYRKRPSNLTVFEHLNTCISEVTTSFYTLFHDDDLMLPNYVSSFWSAQNQFPNAIAYGGNALVEKNDHVIGVSFKAAADCEVINCPDDLAAKYFSRHQLGIAPFPSYIYRRSDACSLMFELHAGKYSDVQSLLQLADCGSFVWIKEPMMVYRLHGSNDSNVESFGDRLKFLAFLKRKGRALSPITLLNYRRFIYKKYLLSGSSFKAEKRQKRIRRFLAYCEWSPGFIEANFMALIKKISTKAQINLKRWIA
jgi:glycosyltransferase involved in cell wall biosynthesis